VLDFPRADTGVLGAALGHPAAGAASATTSGPHDRSRLSAPRAPRFACANLTASHLPSASHPARCPHQAVPLRCCSLAVRRGKVPQGSAHDSDVSRRRSDAAACSLMGLARLAPDPPDHLVRRRSPTPPGPPVAWFAASPVVTVLSYAQRGSWCCSRESRGSEAERQSDDPQEHRLTRVRTKTPPPEDVLPSAWDRRLEKGCSRWARPRAPGGCRGVAAGDHSSVTAGL